MASFTVKNIPSELLEALKARAARNQRSINQEAIFLLRMALADPRRNRAEAEQLLQHLDRLGR